MQSIFKKIKEVVDVIKHPRGDVFAGAGLMKYEKGKAQVKASRKCRKTRVKYA